MPTTKMVCRLFDSAGAMLGWTSHDAAIRGDGMIRASSSIAVPIEREGYIAEVSWHWVDVNVETRVSLLGRHVSPGVLFQVAQFNDPLIHCGPMPGPLPAVTVRQPVAIGLLPAQMGAHGTA